MPVVTLREYMESRLAAMEQAVTKAEIAAEKRFESINEMRAMVTDAALQYMPRKEFEASHTSIMEKIEFLQKIVMPRGEYEVEHKNLVEKVEIIDKFYLPRPENDSQRQTIIAKNDGEHKQLSQKIDALQKIVWIGIGILTTLQFLLSIFVIWWKRSG
jgi:hypothetical protein